MYRSPDPTKGKSLVFGLPAHVYIYILIAFPTQITALQWIFRVP